MKHRRTAGAVILLTLLGATGCHARQPTPHTVHQAAASILASASPAASASILAAAPPAASVLAPDGKYLGVAEPSAAAVKAFGTATGTVPDMVEQYIGWGANVPALPGSELPLLSWMSTGDLAAIAEGADDAYITRVAGQIRAHGAAVALTFDHEFNGDWYPYGTQADSAAEFVAAWRHVHDLFASAGAVNVVWVWTPNVVNPMPAVQLAPYWPGAAYVDWAGIVGYWTGELGEDSWSTLYGPTEQQIEAVTPDPILIVETGAAQGPQKAGWVTAMLAGLAADSRVVGMVYFDYGTAQGKRADWTLQDDPAALAAYRAGAAQLQLARIP
jgi:hypothetical protein